MSKGTGVGVGESNWKDSLRGQHLAAAIGRVTAAGLAGLIVAAA